jgi:hypothetical protein
MSDSRKERCETCKFWDRHEPDGPSPCRRYPPKVMQKQLWQEDKDLTDIDIAYASICPRTLHNCFCGEWKPAE